jgi:aldehyde:ferredoxin oxidoreductase
MTGGGAPSGVFGRYLRVDLTQNQVSVRDIPSSLTRAVIGGVGLGVALLIDETPARYDPLGPDACIVFAFSPMVGTPITTSAKFAVVAKSPLTGRICDALSSSDFAFRGKKTGHDAIVLRGQAAVPSVVLVDEGGARIALCPELWGTGRPIDDIEQQLHTMHPGYSFALIGSAGEKLVRYASISNGRRHAGRGGLGAVLGAMRIKAIGVRGKATITLADADTVVAIARDLAARSLGPATEKYRVVGTIANLTTFNRLAALPTRNFRESTFEGAERIGGAELESIRREGKSACRNCTIGCEHFFGARDGAVKMEYESLFALGPLCGVADPELTVAATKTCDALGIDTISAGGTIALLMECAERGLLDGTAYQDARLVFGSPALCELLALAAGRTGALGDLLAEGSRIAAERIGPPAPRFAPHVKGLEIPGYEPRALQTMALGFAVGTRGADHNKSGAYEVDFNSRVDRFAPGPEAAAMAAETEDRAALIDSLILCKFLRGVFDDLHAESARALAAITGWPYDGAELRRAARRIVTLRKLFNQREGWTRDEDTLPERFLSEPLPSGAATGAIVDRQRLDMLIAGYYRTRGWDADGRVPETVIADLTPWLA